MRVFNSTIQAILDSQSIEFFFLIKLELHSATKYLTDISYDVVFDGQTYVGNSSLFEYDSPKFSSVVDREAYKIVLTDFINEFSTEMKNNMVGKNIEVRVGFYDSSGVPILNVANTMFVYKGTIDRPILQSSEDNKIAVIEGTSPMSDLDLVRSFMTSRQGMAQRSGVNSNGDPLDTSFDNMYDNKEIMVKWGKV